jgi:hypothetical protein
MFENLLAKQKKTSKKIEIQRISKKTKPKTLQK